MRLGCERVLIFAVSQIFWATKVLTRENEVVRNCDIKQVTESLSIVTNWPSSMP